MTYRIDKTFEFCYGHRVWTQVLDDRFSNDLQCACRHLHGHEAKVQVFLENEHTVNGMVTDFRHLEWLKSGINRTIDHRFIIDSNDPLFDHLTMGGEQLPHVKLVPITLGGSANAAREFDTADLIGQGSALQKELLNGFLVVDFTPTSENLARWLHGIVAITMAQLNVKCTRVDWWETPKSRSSYRV